MSRYKNKDYENSAFYKSQAWKRASAAYMASQHYICERCGQPARICHHKTWLNGRNVDDPAIALDASNLEALCIECHNKEHFKGLQQRDSYNGITFDENGNPVKATEAFIVHGAPGSGKSTYVQQHKGANDIVFDMDAVCMALMGNDLAHEKHDIALAVALEMRDAFYKCVEVHKGYWDKAWVITCTTDDAALQLLAQRLRAEIITMPTTLEECIARIKQDPSRPNKQLYVELAREWYRARGLEV